MENVQKILESQASSTSSKWRENAEWRRANRKWLKKSQQIAMAVLDCMDAAQMNQKDLAQKMGVSTQYVSKLLKGSQNLSLETISKIEEILNTNILVIQNFVTNQHVTSVSNWQMPTFSVIKATEEQCQSYKETSMMTYFGDECTDAA